ENKEVVEDNGLGLSDFLNSGTQEGENEPSPETDGKTDETPESTTEGEGQEETPEGEGVEGEKESAEESPEKEPSDPWESEDNPYLKRYKDTRDWATRVNQENQQLKEQLSMMTAHLQRLEKKLDGEWTEEDEAEQAPELQADVIAQNAELQGRITASRELAISQYGADKVEQLLFAPDAPFREIENDPLIQARILQSEAPVMEALRIVEEKQWYDKWGYDLAKAEEKIREDERAKLEKTIREEIMKELSGKAKMKEKLDTGLSDVKGSGDYGSPPKEYTPLSELFS
ncbi:MAG: hypothetical protein D6726_02920, partial [Nitrospirae bacterium]